MDSSGSTKHGTPSLLRDINDARILASLRRLGPLSRAALARETGVSKVTASAVVGELLRAGVLRETELAGRGAGRPPRLVDIAPDVGVVAAADIDAGTASVRVVDLHGTLCGEGELAVPDDAKSGGIEALAGILADEVHVLRSRCTADPPLLQLTAAVSATVGPDGELSFPGHPRYLSGGRFVAALRDRIPEGGVTLVNDTNAGAIGEARLGAAGAWRNFAFLAVRRSGIGMGLMLDGAIHQGAHGWAGEVGMLRTPGSGPVGTGPAAIEDLDAFVELVRVVATSFVLLDLEALVLQVEREEATDWLTEIRKHMTALVPFPAAIVESELHGKAPLLGAQELALADGWRSVEARVSASRARAR